MQNRDRHLRDLTVAVGIIAMAYVANAFFNHTAWGLRMKSHGSVYVFAFFLPFGVIVPAAYLGWIVRMRGVSARWLGARIGWRDAATVAAVLVIGGFLATRAVRSGFGDTSMPHRLFALLLVASAAEVLLFLGTLGNAIRLAMPDARPWRSGLVTLVLSSLAFGFFHFTYPAPWNTLGGVLGLTLVWVPTSLVFLLSRSLLASVIFNNFMAMIGFLKNQIDLPGTTSTGWMHAVVACVLFALVFRLTARERAGALRDDGGRYPNIDRR